MMNLNFENMMKALQGNLTNKINELEEMEQAIDNKKNEINEVNDTMTGIEMNIQMIEIMKQELLDEKKAMEEKQKELVLELSEMQHKLDTDKLGKMLKKISEAPSDKENNNENN